MILYSSLMLPPLFSTMIFIHVLLRESYGSRVSPNVLSDRVAYYVHYFTLHGSLRPFGASVILAAYDDELKEPQLYVHCSCLCIYGGM